MRFHDYHLRGYTISDGGAVVTLDLAYDYPDQPKRQSTIRFDGVRLHHFILSSGAIITSIEEVPIASLVEAHASDLAAWAKRQGLNDWRSDTAQLATDWSQQGLRAWYIESAVGFSGYVVGRNAG